MAALAAITTNKTLLSGDKNGEAIMNEQPDFLKAAEKAYDLSDELSARMDGAENADYFADNMMRSREWAMRAQAMALLSLAQDVRRVADTLKEIEGALVDASGCYR